MEVWKDIEGYEGKYKISSYGRVKNKKDYIFKERLTFDGYVKVTLLKNGIAKDYRVHRLVAIAFMPNVDFLSKTTVNHKDCNKRNNNVDNLEWFDRHEQLKHAYANNRKPKLSGTLNPNSKLSKEDVLYIRKNYKRQCTKFGSVALGKKFGVDNSIINKVVRGISYKNVK
jgi:hypothetical protein